MTSLQNSGLWRPKHYRVPEVVAGGDASDEAEASTDEDFWVAGAESPVDAAGDRIGAAEWLSRADALDIPDFVWVRIPEPSGWRIVVQEWAPPKKSRGGIIFADDSGDYHRAANFIGRVLAVGPTCYRHPKFTVINADGERHLQAPWCKPGQWITFSQYTGTPRTIKHEGTEWRFRFIFDENVEGWAPTPHGMKVYA